MNSKTLTLTYFNMFLSSLLALQIAQAAPLSDLIIRHAEQDDLPAILELDRQVTLEFFKSLYSNHYGQFEFGKNPDYFLELELKSDAETFPEYISQQGPERILIAYDKSSKRIAGFIVFHNDESLVHIDLLLVDKNLRRMSAGRKLITSMLQCNPSATACIVYPLKFGNDATLAFYESLGFVNQGPPAQDMMTPYGISCDTIQWFYKLTINEPKQAILS